MYLLDTDTIIYFFKNDAAVVANFRLHDDSPKAISVITYAELLYGAENSERRNENMARIHRFCELVPVIDVTRAVMETFSSTKLSLRKSGKPLDDFDLVIASTAITLGYSIVTNNVRHFSRIRGLKTENWKNEAIS
ncbi:MAG TPA: VapC toxin family PIN domain ribonuclease [Lentisphaeria bacterium]|nr:MAG: nucleic acid-binding protein [Lentisphaerae bacterium GWF2_50_93]HCE43340.1 VapC toxin family PIN domain ribonuclease [Lentisphaeria bacterium]